MDVQQFFKRDHALIKELFDKLAQTSDHALKTRERVFAQLMTEIEAHKTVVEQRLYPILAKHKETRNLKPSARERSQIDRQLSQVEDIPKDDPHFLPKLRELKKTVEAQLREEARHIVPALKKALEPEAFKALARELAEGKREEQQGARQRAENGAGPGRDREPGRGTAGEASKSAQALLREMEEVGQGGAYRLLEEQRRLSETAQAMGSASLESASALTSHGIEDAAAASREAAAGAQEIQEALLNGVAETLRVNADGFRGLLRCGSVAELSTLQRRLIEQWTRVSIDTGARVLRAAQRATLSALAPQREPSSRSGRR
jgi:hypothetical protein